jgi:peptidoglycan hydrolase-like protein with peptidoglycan-binding domain
MQRSLTAFIALAAAAGFIGLAQAQTTSTTTMPSATAPSTQATPPSATTPTTPSAAPANPSMAPANPSAARPAPQASAQQPAEGNGFWSRNISQDEVRQAQQNLQAQGLYRGPVDGKVGSQMERALAQFQRQHGLRQTGTLDEQTMSQLGGAGPAIGSSMPPAGSTAPAATATAPTSAPSASTTTSPIGAGGTSTGTSTTAPSPSPTQPVTR